MEQTKSFTFLGQESLKTNYKQDPKLSFVIKAIYSVAHALHNMIQTICGPISGFCPQMLPFNGSLLKVAVSQRKPVKL